MALRSPLWAQNVEYSASDDRWLIASTFGYQPRVLWGLEVTDGPGFGEVIVAPGQAIVGDRDGTPEMVLVTIDAPESVTAGVAPVAFAVVLRFFSSSEQAAIAAPDQGNEQPVDVVLATIAPSSPGGITPGHITDARQIAPANMLTVGTDPPPALMLPGERYLRVS